MIYTPIRFGIVGCGVIAPTHADALNAIAQKDAVLAACCDSVPEKARAFGDKYGIPAVSLDQMLSDPSIDAISVCTPSGLHGRIAAAALRAGKHAIVEKPMEVTVEACDQLGAVAAKSGKTFGVISQHRFDPASLRVKAAMDEQALGPIVLAEAQVCWYRSQQYYDAGDWRGTWAMDGGGCLMNQGVHTVDLLLWLAGPVTSVHALMRTAAHERIEVEDIVVATLTFESGAIGALTATTAAYPGFPAKLALYGTSGSAIVEGDRLNTLVAVGHSREGGDRAAGHALSIATGGTHTLPTPSADMATREQEWGDAHRAQLENFIHCCRTGNPPLVDAAAGRAAVALIRAVYQSALSGETVFLTRESA